MGELGACREVILGKRHVILQLGENIWTGVLSESASGGKRS